MSSIKKNYIYNTIYNILSIIIPLITTPYISRVLGPEGIGIYSYTYSISYYFSMFIILGLNKYGNRTISSIKGDSEKVNKVFCEIFAMQFIIGIIVSLIYVFCFFNIFTSYKLIQLIQFIYVLASVFDITWFFFGMEEFKFTVTKNIIIRLLNLILIFILVKDSNGLLMYTIIMSTTTLLSQLSLWPLLFKKYIKLSFPKFKDIIQHLKPNLLLFVPTVAVSLYKIMDKIMLGFMVNATHVGYYENAEKIINIPMMFITSLGIVMLPRMSNIVSNGDEKKEKKYIDLSMTFILWISTALCYGIAAISDVFVPWFLGNQFMKTSELLCILVPTVIFSSWGNVITNQILIPRKKDISLIVSVSAGALCNLILNMILIPVLQSNGAAVATLITELVVCIFYIINSKKLFDWKKYLKEELLYIIPGLIMLMLVTNINITIFNDFMCILVKILLGAITYIVLTFINVKIFDKEKYIYLENFKKIVLKK